VNLSRELEMTSLDEETVVPNGQHFIGVEWMLQWHKWSCQLFILQPVGGHFRYFLLFVRV
jgi:hypothetical protein